MKVVTDIWVEACAISLIHLKAIGPSRLRTMLDDAAPDAIWEALASGSPTESTIKAAIYKPGLIDEWKKFARSVDPLQLAERYRDFDVKVWTRYGDYPERLQHDEHAPDVLFTRGNEALLVEPTVAIIGTRNCTREGRALATKFGLELAEAGVAVVSGLALGVDGAAHQGVFKASFGVGPIGVVGSGLDVVYPKRHRDLWSAVSEQGLLVSESALGVSPEGWRFPSRNRIIAGLADVLLVIESHDRGGSLLTVNEAIDRSIPIMAVPGSIQSPASRGSNRLLADCASPACSTEDVLDELRWVRATDFGRYPDRAEQAIVVPLEHDVPVFAAVDYAATSTDEILLRTSMPLGEVALALMRLEARGLVSSEEGWWYRK